MAISPEEVGKLSPAELQQVAKLEEVIDYRLRESGLGMTYPLHRIPARVVAELRKRYASVGWQVTRTTDQREGDFLTFSVPRVRFAGE